MSIVISQSWHSCHLSNFTLWNKQSPLWLHLPRFQCGGGGVGRGLMVYKFFFNCRLRMVSTVWTCSSPLSIKWLHVKQYSMSLSVKLFRRSSLYKWTKTTCMTSWSENLSLFAVQQQKWMHLQLYQTSYWAPQSVQTTEYTSNAFKKTSRQQSVVP